MDVGLDELCDGLWDAVLQLVLDGRGPDQGQVHLDLLGGLGGHLLLVVDVPLGLLIDLVPGECSTVPFWIYLQGDPSG